MQRKHTLDLADEHEIVPRDDDHRQGGTELATEQRSGVNRRRFLLAGAGAAALVAAGPSVVNAQRQSGSAQGRTRRRAAATTTSAPLVQFKEPKALSSQKGQLSLQLDAVWASWPFSCTGTSPTDQVPTYNGQVIGPTLYINPGDQVHITLRNNLTTDPFTGDKCEQNMHMTPYPYQDDSVAAMMQREMLRLLRQHGFHGREGEPHQRQLLAAYSQHGATVLAPVVVTQWPVRRTPWQSIEAWHANPGLGGIDLSPAMKRTILQALCSWATGTFGSLHHEVISNESYVLQGVRLRPARSSL